MCVVDGEMTRFSFKEKDDLFFSFFFFEVSINDVCFFYLSSYGAFRSRKIGGSLKGINR